MIISQFEDRLANLITLAQRDGLRFGGSGNGLWFATVATAGLEEAVDLSDPISVRDKLADRSGLDDSISKALTGQERLHTYMEAAIQTGWLAGLQRDLVQRHSSRLQIVARELSRRVGHGHERGVLRGQIHRRVTQLAAQGGDQEQ